MKNNSDNIAAIQQHIAPIKEAIVAHKVYSTIHNLSDLHIFMQHHVFAVWDFMSLLKSLQQHLTCTTTPWMPVGNAATRFFINEIVVGEESDVLPNGIYTSHYELYLKAMQEVHKEQPLIESFLTALQQTGDIQTALDTSALPIGVKNFMGYTFGLIAKGKVHELAACFTFGREDLIPDMFLSMVRQLHAANPDQLATFLYYLERHIAIDGDHHAALATNMVAALCGNDATLWAEAKAVAETSLNMRIQLWDGILTELEAKKA